MMKQGLTRDGTTRATRSALLCGALTIVACGGRLAELPGDPDAGAARDAATACDGGALRPGVTPPARPAGTASGLRRWFAVSSVVLGVTRPDDYGFDLALRTSGACEPACRPRAGGAPRAEIDSGIDNAFGESVVPAVLASRPDLESVSDRFLRLGDATLLLRLDNVQADDNASVPGALFVAGPLGGDPTFTVTDQWRVLATSLEDGKDLARPKVTFPSGYMRGGVWVSGNLGAESAVLTLPLMGALVTLPLESVVLAVRVADGSGGIIAGGAPLGALTVALTPALRRLGICPGSAAFASVVEAAGRGADLVHGAPQLGNPARECDVVSLGLGFTMSPTTTPDEAFPPLVAPADSCAN